MSNVKWCNMKKIFFCLCEFKKYQGKKTKQVFQIGSAYNVLYLIVIDRIFSIFQNTCMIQLIYQYVCGTHENI